MLMLPLASVSAKFTIYDWGIVVAYLVFTTLLGIRMAGKQATLRDFFLGGRKLPWYAVSGSIVATEISAVTFIGVPYVVFKPGGNFTYLQLGVFGSILARILVGYFIVPMYYRREIYSPYDYMGNQLGTRVRTMTSGLFVLGAILSQAARVYLTAQIMIVLLNDQLKWLEAATRIDGLAWAIIIIGVVATGWTLIGGITTVIWSNVVLFLVFFIGAGVALGTIAYELPGGFFEIFREGWRAKESGAWGKFTFFDFSPSPFKEYTIWTAVIASTWGGLFAYGTDQMLVQGMFCCRDHRQARRAIIGSSIGQLVTAIVMVVGAGLYAYYKRNPLSGDALELFTGKGDRIFPIFICEVVPRFLKGLIMAAAFAAAVSTVMGILTALSQTVMGAFYTPLREWARGGKPGTRDQAAEDRRNVLLSRCLVVFWGAVLCVMAYITNRIATEYKSILDLALAMAGFTGGAVIGCFVLAVLPIPIDGRGYMWAAPLSVFSVFALVWHYEWSHPVCWAFAAVLLTLWIVRLMTEAMRVAALADPTEQRRRAIALVVRDWPQTLILVAGLAMVLWINYYGHWGLIEGDGGMKYKVVAWPWYAPFGCVVAVVFGYLLGRRRESNVEPAA